MVGELMLFENFKEEKLYSYEDRIFKFVEKYELIFKKIINFIDKLVITTVSFYEKAIFAFIYIISFTGKVMRYSTFPLHWIWIKLELRKQDKGLLNYPLFEIGAHYIYGPPKSGKSTVMYHAMMDYAYYTGKTSYTTEYMEKPRTDLYGNQYYYHQVFTASDFYKDGEQIASFDTRNFNVVVYEEMLTKYQQRNNKEKTYNNEVLPMIAAMGTQRHQGIDMFFFISQLPRNDIAIMQMLVKYHEPKIKKVFDYRNWLSTGGFRFKIKGWYMTTHDIQITSGSDYKLVNKYRWFYHNKYPKDFEYFNKLNMKDIFAKLPKHIGKEMH